MSIKRSERSYQAVSETIEGLLVSVEAAAATSPLPEEPDQRFIDDLVAQAYRGKILAAA